MGWTPFPSSHIHLHPHLQNGLQNGLTNGHGSGSHVKLLHRGDLEKLCAIDEAVVRRRMASWKGEGPAVALVPDHKTIAWHHTREEFVSKEVLGRSPEVKGALIHTETSRIWCIWTHVFHNKDPQSSEGNTMHILRLVVEDDSLADERSDRDETHLAGIVELLKAAQRDAHEWNMAEIELWNPVPRSVMAVQRLEPTAKVVDRDSESITSLKWYGQAGEKVEWLENEKYGWC